MEATRLLVGSQGILVPGGATDTKYIDDTFDAGGHFARLDPNYSVRLGQKTISYGAHTCFETSVPAMVEAPCGLGKTLAYSAPASRLASRGHRVIIVTATNALLGQVAHGDLPRLKRAVPWQFTHKKLKGRGQYLCLKKEAGFAPSLLRPSERIAAKALMGWAKTTETGDRDEAPPEAHDIWSHVSVGPEECTRDTCRVKEFCFAEKARNEAAEADIVVTNMHMLALHLQTGRVLPDFHAMVIDEADELADVCQNFMGESMSRAQAKKLVAHCNVAGVDATLCKEHFDRLFDSCLVAMAHPLDAMFADGPKSNESGERTLGIDSLPGGNPVALQTQLQIVYRGLEAVLENDAKQRQNNGFSMVGESVVEAAKVARRMIDRFSRVLFLKSEGQVRWLEAGRNGAVEIHIEPVTVGPALHSMLFEQYPRTFLTSATLTTGGTFHFVRSELGVPRHAPETVIDSPFDFEQQSMLIVPPLPNPDENPEGWADGVQQVLRYIVRVIDGRTMGLFTSTARMKAAAANLELAEGGRREILVQGNGPLRVLIDKKRADERSVLLGLNSLWTGVDLQGDTVSAVLMDRLPLLAGSPQLDAVKSAMKTDVWTDKDGVERRGKDFFTNYYFPKSARRLRQGFGRGVRSKRDVCVIIVCDNRILTRPYGATFLKSLPKMDLSRRLEDIVPFLKYARGVVRGVK